MIKFRHGVMNFRRHQWHIRESESKTGQTSEYPISTNQFVALSIHTNQQYIKYSKNKRTEKSNMGKNSKSDEKHTWAALVAIALFSNSFVLFLKTISESPLFQPPQKNSFFSTCFHVYISAPSKTQICSQNKKENPPFLFVLFFLF